MSTRARTWVACMISVLTSFGFRSENKEILARIIHCYALFASTIVQMTSALLRCDVIRCQSGGGGRNEKDTRRKWRQQSQDSNQLSWKLIQSPAPQVIEDELKVNRGIVILVKGMIWIFKSLFRNPIKIDNISWNTMRDDDEPSTVWKEQKIK